MKDWQRRKVIDSFREVASGPPADDVIALGERMRIFRAGLSLPLAVPSPSAPARSWRQAPGGKAALRRDTGARAPRPEPVVESGAMLRLLAPDPPKPRVFHWTLRWDDMAGDPPGEEWRTVFSRDDWSSDKKSDKTKEKK